MYSLTLGICFFSLLSLPPSLLLLLYFVEGGDLEASEYRSIYSYQPETESRLVFGEGDTVLVYWGQDNGWWFGEAAGEHGWFPESYVEVRMQLGL